MGYLANFVLLLLVAFSYDKISARRLVETKDGKIVGGTEVDIQDYPYMAYLLLFNGSATFECGGSIISRRHILTAAHCLEEIMNVTARIGSLQAFSGGQTYESSYLYTHPEYNDNNYDYDVALIRMSELMDLDGTNTRRAPLVRGGRVIPSGTNVTITGWGATSEGGSGNGNLMGTTVPTLSNPECQEIFGEDTVTDRLFCAGLTEGGRDTCQGDSGGPAVSNTNGRQIGIVSSGFGCARPNSPGFYTNITNVEIRKWIRLIAGV